MPRRPIIFHSNRIIYSIMRLNGRPLFFFHRGRRSELTTMSASLIGRHCQAPCFRRLLSALRASRFSTWSAFQVGAGCHKHVEGFVGQDQHRVTSMVCLYRSNQVFAILDSVAQECVCSRERKYHETREYFVGRIRNGRADECIGSRKCRWIV